MDLKTKNKNFRAIISLVIINIFLSNLVSTSVIYAEEIYFIIQGVSFGVMPDRKPLPATIYRFEMSNNRLQAVWSLNDNKVSVNIKVYYSLGLVIIGEGGVWDPYALEKIHLLNMTDLEDSKDFNVKLDFEEVFKYNYAIDQGGKGYFQLWYIEDKNNWRTGKQSLKFKPLYIKDEKRNKSEHSPGDELKLAGLYSRYGPSQHDIINFSQPVAGKFVPIYPYRGFNNIIPTIPDDIIRTKTTKGWNLIANENNFKALLAIPDRKGIYNRELLIFIRNTDVPPRISTISKLVFLS